LVNQIPDTTSEKYEKEKENLTNTEKELENLENKAKEERNLVNKLNDRLKNIKAAYKAKKFCHDQISPDLKELHKIMDDQDSEIKDMFSKIDSTENMENNDKIKLIEGCKNKLSDLNKTQHDIGEKLVNVDELAREYYKLIDKVPDKESFHYIERMNCAEKTNDVIENLKSREGKEIKDLKKLEEALNNAEAGQVATTY